MTEQGVPYTKQILIVSTIMDLNGFTIGPEIKMFSTYKVGTPTARHPVYLVAINLGRSPGSWAVLQLATAQAGQGNSPN